MISNATILGCVFTLFVSLFLPVLILIVLGLKNKKQGVWSAWFLGAAGFFVPQILIRLPILSALSGAQWFLDFAANHPVLYGLLLAFSAAVFEMAGRFAVAKILEKKLTYRRALAAGLGHGGIESMVIVGVSYINNLAYIALIQSGSFDAVLAQMGEMPEVVAQLEMIRDSLLNTSSALFFLAGAERLLTMVCHTAMSMIVCYAVHVKRVIPGLLLCLGIHTLIDAAAGITLLVGERLTQNAIYTIIYVILVAVVVFSLLIIKEIRKRWQEESANGGAL